MSIRDPLCVATAVERAILAHSHACHLGAREVHDARAGKTRVDFVYEQAQPCPIALEISQVVDPAEEAASAEVGKLLDELRETVRREQLGHWVIGIRALADVRPMRDEILAAMRCGLSIAVDQYRPPWFPQGTREGAGAYYEELRGRLLAMGVFRVWRSDEIAIRHDVVSLSAFPVVGVVGFDAALADRLRDNARKLGEARPRATHLAVPVVRRSASDDPMLTTAPSLPEEIDVLWVVHGLDARGDAHGWWTSRDKPGWQEIASEDFSAF